MRRSFLVLAASVCLGLVGCIAAPTAPPKPVPTAQEIRDAYYGDTPKPEEYEKIVQDHFAKTLFDPYSAKYVFNGSPLKGYVTYWLIGPRTWVHQFGYCGTVSVNSRNRFGGYVGATQYGYIIRNNAVVETVIGMECVPLENVR
jgi:hypothetical protein